MKQYYALRHTCMWLLNFKLSDDTEIIENYLAIPVYRAIQERA